MVIAKTKKKKEKNKTNKNKRTNNLGGSNPSANIHETINLPPPPPPPVVAPSQVPLYFPNLIKKSEQDFNAETQNIVTVFSGLSNENGENLLSHCSEVGSSIAKEGFTMVCAGANIGCQGSLVKSAIGSEGKVIAVTIPKFAGEVTAGVEETIVIDSTDLSERKNVMKKLATFGFIILPGGPGTFDELWEVISERAEGLGEGSQKNIVVINTDGFFEPVKEQLKIMSRYFDWSKYEKNVTFIDDINQIKQLFENYLN